MRYSARSKLMREKWERQDYRDVTIAAKPQTLAHPRR
jgi:hypothetical protein